MAGADARRIGLYGFGAAAHIAAQVARHEGREVYAFTRSGRTTGGAGASSAEPRRSASRRPLGPSRGGYGAAGRAILFAPVGALVPAALRAVDRGGTVVCAGIHMQRHPRSPSSSPGSWRTVRSVANLTRATAIGASPHASAVPVSATRRRKRLSGSIDANRDRCRRLRARLKEWRAVVVPLP